MKSVMLIEELTPGQSNIIEEMSNDGKNVFLSGIFMQGGIINRNKRKYPVTEIAKAVQEGLTRIKETGGIFGELDHPQTLNINLDRISHVITELRMEGDNAVGRAKLLETPMGKIAKELLKSGVRIGVSSRGAGTVTESGDVTDFNFVTMDIVCTPSAPGAMPDSVYESLNATKTGKVVMSLAEQLRDDPAAQKYFAIELRKFIEQITAK
jgi:hypothetical protein